ncbi:MAG TPA: exonuclease SbcCD subunit D, partial [Clostridiales bacterium]|nr:exonuclease SbcCD subunit D [Clostridiales bacterium]
KISGVEMEEIDLNIEKSFEEIFRDFYMKERNVDPDDEVVDILLSILNQEESENETA